MDITGILKIQGKTQKVSEKFSKREFVITENSSKYPQDIMFHLTQDRCDLIDDYKVGDVINVSFNLRGREWTSPQGEVKYFNTLEAWKLNSITNLSHETKEDNTAQNISSLKNNQDDLPF